MSEVLICYDTSQESKFKVSTRLTIANIAQLANLSLNKQDENKFQQAFDATIKVIENLNELNIKNVTPTHQVTGTQNQWREDKILPSLSQDQALANAKKKHQGYFVVNRIIDHD